MLVTPEAHDFLLKLAKRQNKHTVQIAFRGNKR